MFFCCNSFAQNTISGVVIDNNKQPVVGANVKLLEDKISEVSSTEGKFILKTNKDFPLTIVVSSIGFKSEKIRLSSKQDVVTIIMFAEENRLNEIVVSASRTPERIMESPVTIERMSSQDIKKSTATTFYDGLENLKEVHFNTSSMSFKSINTRGFATINNTRFMQLVDGMDNSSPALNFPLGNLIGMSDLDVQNVELLPGASSALYGANAFNGILFMNSKSPFVSQGISAYFKYGQTVQKVAGTNDYYDYGIRAAHAFSKYFAAKANFTFMKGKEWMAADTRDVNGGLEGHALNRNYNGINDYGDEVSVFIANVGQISRTGYREQDLTNNDVKNVKADFALHFKPFANDFEIILQHKVGMGNTVYQGSSRYMMKNFFMQQSRIEFKGKHFFVRGYMTSEDAGDSYDMQFTALNINRLAKSDKNWFTDYSEMYLGSQIYLGQTAKQADALARNWADNNVNLTPLSLTPRGLPQFKPGTVEFQNAFQSVITNPDFNTGSKFLDKSIVYHSDANYNFKEQIKFAEVQFGGSYRRYVMDSQGTIFTDFDGPLSYNEYGMYTQVQKKLMQERLKFTGSVRYDKSKNFDGQYSPRISFVYSAGERKNKNYRVSFQTGFRNPTTQDQYIGLKLSPFALIGSAPDNLTRFSEVRGNDGISGIISQEGQVILGSSTITLTGQDAYNRPSYTEASVKAFKISQNTDDLKVANKPTLVRPEQVKAIELGYKSILDNGLSIDLNGYYNFYNHFLSTTRIVLPYYGVAGDATAVQAIRNDDSRTYQIYSNTSSQITSLGFGVGLSKKVYKNYELGVNYNHAEFNFDQSKDPSFIAAFNTPKHRIKASLGNNRLFKNFGCNLNVRWSDTYKWQSSFADGTIPTITVLDAQVNYAIPALKSVVKLTATNIGGNDYLQVVGAGRIGQQYLVSWTINP